MLDLSRVAYALSDPLRIRILDLLAQARCQACSSPANPEMPEAICACDLVPQLGNMTPSRLAYHLKVLRLTGLIAERRRGKWVYYTLDAAAFERFAGVVAERFAAPRPSAVRRCGGRSTT